MRAQLDHARTLRFTKKEMIWLAGNSFYGRKQIFQPEFLNWLHDFQLPEYDLRRKDGQVLDLVIIQRDPLYDRAINPFIENLGNLGIQGRLERVDTAQYVERRRSGAFDLPLVAIDEAGNLVAAGDQDGRVTLFDGAGTHQGEPIALESCALAPA